MVTGSIGHSNEIGAGHFRVGIADARKVGHARGHVQVFEHDISARVLAHSGNLALGVSDVAKNDRVVRAGLLAGNLERCNRRIAGRRGASLDETGDFCFFDALDTKGALFHDPAHTHGDVWIFGHLEAVSHAFFGQRAPIKLVDWALIIIEVIEPANLPRAVVCAVTGANATIVGHEVQPILAVNCRIYRTDSFTWSVLTMLAHDRMGEHLRITGIAGEVAVETNPSHVSIFTDLILSDNRNVIFSLAGHNASITPSAGVEIDRHSPLVFGIQLGVGVE
jgi:hypothetical protein